MAKTSRVREVYDGSNGAATRWLCAEFEQNGHIGRIAAALFNAQKTSSRAREYQGGIECPGGLTIPFTEIAYRRKAVIVERLADLLARDDCGMVWGWSVNPRQPIAQHVLYIDLPQGQVSFHSVRRFIGRDYPGAWDGMNANEDRIIQFCETVWRGGSPTGGMGSKGLGT